MNIHKYFLFLLLLIPISTISSQGISNQALLERIADLERRVAFLESVILENNVTIQKEQPTIIEPIVGWRQLRTNMSLLEVRALLGDPTHVQNSGTLLIWSFSYGQLSGMVHFIEEKVYSWMEPF